jgi:hypothetical protein
VSQGDNTARAQFRKDVLVSLDSPPRPKNPGKVAAGKATAAKRWGPDGRILRLDRMDSVTREVVLTIVRARKNAAEAAARGSGQG